MQTADGRADEPESEYQTAGVNGKKCDFENKCERTIESPPFDVKSKCAGVCWRIMKLERLLGSHFEQSD